MAWVTGAEILTHVGKSVPTAADEAWADQCAAAIDAEIVRRLDGTDIADDDVAGGALAIKPAALQDGADLYVSRRAPDAEAATPDAGDLPALSPVLGRYATPGIG